MTKSVLKLSLLGLLTVALAGLPVGAGAKDTNAPAADKPPVKASASKRAKTAKLPFHGKLKTLDASAKAFTVGERMFQVTSDTIVMKDGKPAVLADAVVGEMVSGYFTTGEDGKLNVGRLNIGGKAVKAAKPDVKKEKVKQD